MCCPSSTWEVTCGWMGTSRTRVTPGAAEPKLGCSESIDRRASNHQSISCLSFLNVKLAVPSSQTVQRKEKKRKISIGFRFNTEISYEFAGTLIQTIQSPYESEKILLLPIGHSSSHPRCIGVSMCKLKI